MLTSQSPFGYYASRAGNSSAGIRTPMVQGGQQPPAQAERFFCVRSMATTLMSGLCGEPQGSPAPCTRSSNPHGSLAPFERGAREFQPYKEACHA